MKILQINKFHYPKGGSETVYFNTCDLLARHGHDVVHFSMRDEKNVDSPTKEFFPQNFDLRSGSLLERSKNAIRFFYNREAERNLEQLVLREKPDVAQIHLFNNSLSVSIFRVLKKHNIPVVLMFHDFRALCPSSLFMLRGKLCERCQAGYYTNCFRHKCYENARMFSGMLMLEIWLKEYFFQLDKYVDRYLFVCDFQKEIHLKYNDYYRNKQNRLYNFSPELYEIKPHFTRGDYFFCYGRITEEKGVETLVRAAAELKDISFKVAGEGPLLDKLTGMNLPNVEFLGFQQGEILHNYIRNASFVIVPSECNENNPLTIVESYMHGKPVIGSKIGGIPEIVTEGEGQTGYLFQTKSKEDLVGCIRKACSLPEEDYLRFSRNARNFAEKNFDPEQYYQNLMVIYKEVIEKKPGIEVTCK